MKTIIRCALIVIAVFLSLHFTAVLVSADPYDVWEDGIDTAQGFTPDSTGGAFTYWAESSNTGGILHYVVKANKFSPTGAALWGAGVNVFESTLPITNLTAVADPQGGVFLAFNQHEEGELNVDFVVHHLNSSGDHLWGPQGSAFTKVIQANEGAILVSDGSDGVITTFPHFAGLKDYGDYDVEVYDILAQHLNGTGQPTWGSPYATIKVSGFSGDRWLKQAISDGAGGVVILHGELVTGIYGGYNVYDAQHVRASGEMAWGMHGRTVCAGQLFSMKMAPDGTGGAFFLWGEMNDTFSYDLFAQVINDQGQDRWSHGGALMARDIQPDDYTHLLLTQIDPFSYLIGFPWTNGYHIGSYELESGWEWEPDTILVAHQNQIAFPTLVADGASNAHFLYRYGHTIDGTPYHVLMDSSGAVDWAEADNLSTFVTGSGEFNAISDGLGGFIVNPGQTAHRLKDDLSRPTQLITGSGLSETTDGTGWVSGPTITITAQDPQSGVASQQFFYTTYPYEWPETAISSFLNGQVFNSTGLYKLQFDVNNGAGMLNSETRYLKVDASGPTLALTGTGLRSTPEETVWVNQSTVTFSATDPHSGVQSQVLHFSRSTEGWPNNSIASFESPHTFTLSGFYRFEVQATDALGNISTLVRYLKIDGESLTIHTYGEGLSAETPDTHWVSSSETGFTIEESISGMQSYSARYGRSNSGWPAATDMDFITNPEVFTEDGYYRIEISATDGVGRTTHVTRYLKVDHTAPTALLEGNGLSEVAGAAEWQASSSVNLSLADSVSGLALSANTYSFRVTDWPGSTNQEMVNNQVFDQTGYYRLKVHGVDYAQNTTTLTRYLKVDATRPVIVLSAPGLSQEQKRTPWVKTATISLSASDAESGLAQLRGSYAFSTSGWPTRDIFTGTFDNGTIFDQTGYYRLNVVAADAVGNQSFVLYWLKIDADAPLVAINGNGLSPTTRGALWTTASSIDYSWDDSLSGLFRTSAFYGFSATSWPVASEQPLSDGERITEAGYYRLLVSVSDAVGNRAAQVRYLKIDGDPPAVLLNGTGLAISESAAAWVNCSTITYQISDRPAGIQEQWMRFDHSTTTWPTSSTRTLESGQTLTADGYYRIQAFAEDTVGNRISLVRWLKIDSSLASIQVSGEGLANETALTSWVTRSNAAYIVSGAGASIRSARYGFDPAGWPSGATEEFTSGQLFNISGYYRFEVRGTSPAGELIEVRFLKIDATAPRLSVSGAGLSSNSAAAPWVSRVTLSITHDDLHSSVVGFEILYSFNAAAFPAQAETAIESTQVFDEAGYYCLLVRVTDAAGNITTATRWFKIDTQALTVHITGLGVAGAPEEVVPVHTVILKFGISGGTGAAIQSARFGFSPTGWTETADHDLINGATFTQPGFYRVEITAKNEAGQQVTAVRWFQVQSEPVEQNQNRVFLPLLVR